MQSQKRPRKRCSLVNSSSSSGSHFACGDQGFDNIARFRTVALIDPMASTAPAAGALRVYKFVDMESGCRCYLAAANTQQPRCLPKTHPRDISQAVQPPSSAVQKMRQSTARATVARRGQRCSPASMEETSASMEACQPASRRCRCGGGASPRTLARSISSCRCASASSCSETIAIASQNSTCCASYRSSSCRIDLHRYRSGQGSGCGHKALGKCLMLGTTSRTRGAEPLQAECCSLDPKPRAVPAGPPFLKQMYWR